MVATGEGTIREFQKPTALTQWSMLTVNDYHSHARRIFSKVSLKSIVLIKKPNKKGNGCAKQRKKDYIWSLNYIKKIVYCKKWLSNKSQRSKIIDKNESFQLDQTQGYFKKKKLWADMRGE